MSDDSPQGFVLSEAAIYSFQCQDHFPDIISFAAAIPPHLRPLFLIPIRLEPVSPHVLVASRVASIPSGQTDVSDMWGTETFVTHDTEPSTPNTEPGSIFDLSEPGSLTHHQENPLEDLNDQSNADSGYFQDADVRDLNPYPYRTPEKPVRHSSTRPVLLLRLALKPSFLQQHAPEKVRSRAKTCTVQLVSYDKNTRVFTFSVKGDTSPRTVQASLSSVDDVAMSCDCPFWRFNGPEFHAVENKFMLGHPFGRATTPDARDPDSKYWLCKHSYAVLRRLDDFVADVVDENWDLDDEQLLEKVDENWDDMEEAAEIPLDEAEQEDVDITIEDVDSVGAPDGASPPAGDEPAEDGAEEDEAADVPEDVPVVEDAGDGDADDEVEDADGADDAQEDDGDDDASDEGGEDTAEEPAPEAGELVPEVEEDVDEEGDEASDEEEEDRDDKDGQGRPR